MGNRTAATSIGQSRTYLPNKLNQYDSYTTTDSGGSSTISLLHDERGNLTSSSNGTGGSSYSYDASDRLVTFISTDPTTGANTHKSVFVYDASKGDC